MKNLIVIAFLVIFIRAHSQSFEGTITWAIKQNPATSGPSTGLTMKVKENTIITLVNGGMMNGIEMWFTDNNKKLPAW